MDYKPTEYCKVCKNYNMSLGHCEKGWNNVFCNLDEFEPSFRVTVLNLLSLLYDNDFPINILDMIENFVIKKY